MYIGCIYLFFIQKEHYHQKSTRFTCVNTEELECQFCQDLITTPHLILLAITIPPLIDF